jgi:hypothetical protein
MHRADRRASVAVPDPLSDARTAGIVKGFRMPAGHGRDEGLGGRRPKSLDGGNRGGSLLRRSLSDYGDLARAFGLIFRFRIGTAAERAPRAWCRSLRVRMER